MKHVVFFGWLLVLLPLAARAVSPGLLMESADAGTLALVDPLAVTGFAPTAGRAGTLVTVAGSGLSDATAVSVNGVAGTIVRATATALTFAVGPGSSTGHIVVSTLMATASSSSTFAIALPMPACFEEVDTVSTPANGGYSLMMGVDYPGYAPGVPASPGRCDDCAQQIDLGFGFEMYGTVYHSCYINSNGTISFTRAVWDYEGHYFPTQPNGSGAYGPMLAPFWNDVCTVSPSSGRIWYKLYPDRLVVLWNRVGYSSFVSSNVPRVADKKNTFQLILRRNTVAPAPAADVTFIYGELQWVTVAGEYTETGFDAADQTHYFNTPGALSASLSTSLPGTCWNFVVGSMQQGGMVGSNRGLELGVTAVSPNPVGVGQELTLTGPALAGTSGAAVNSGEATSTLSHNSATSLTLRAPFDANLGGDTYLKTTAGTVSSTAVNILPEPGNALAFDGSDDYVSVPHATALNLTSALTVEAWVRTSATTAQYLVAKSDDSFYLAVNGGGGGAGKASFLLNGPSAGAWLYGTSTLSDGHWHHLAGTYEGTTLKLYVDGVLESSRAATGAVATGTAPLLLGGGPGKPSLTGSLDEVRLWRTARTAADLVAGLTQAPQPPAADLVAYFNFDRGTPGGQNQGYTTFFDVAGGALATPTNMALTGSLSNFVESYALVVPAALSAVGVTPTAFTLKWQLAPRGSVSSYVVDVSTSATFATATTYTLAYTATSQTMTGLTAGTRYYYRVRADRSLAVAGQGAYASGSLTTPTTAPSCGASIGSFTPASGTIGSTVVTLTVANAAAVTAVSFGGVATTSFTVVGTTTIQVTVPPGALSGSLGLVTACGTSSSGSAFAVSAPTLSQISPAAELPGQTVNVIGTGFGPSSTVRFGSQPAAVTYVSPTQLQAVVPVPAVGYYYANTTKATVNTPEAAAATAAAFTTLKVASPATFNACTTVPAVTVAADNNWHYLLSTEGQVVLAINSQGRNLGTVGASYLWTDPAQAVRRDSHGQYYLGRNWRLTTSAGPFPGSSVRVRYYGISTEYDQLQAADPGHVAALSSLRLTQYSGPNEDCVLANNDNVTGTSTLLTPTVTAGPDGSYFFVAEATVPNHFSEFYLGATATPLPVELSAFTATRRPGQAAVRLAWSTASEKNSDRFEVERSTDGRAFERIGTVAAAGSSSAPHAYELLDAPLPVGAAVLYYRLRPVDLDGTASYSPVRSVQLTATGGLSLYPNPTSRVATLSGAVPGTPVMVMDALGRSVASATADATGTAALALPAGLAAGVYVVRAGSTALRLTVE